MNIFAVVLWLTVGIGIVIQGVISLELLTVFFDGPLAVYICYLLAKKNPMANIWMIVLATCELYGGM